MLAHRPVRQPATCSAELRTTWARPERSLMTRNVIDFSCRLRCSQPAMHTCAPTCDGRSAASTREIIATPFRDADPWECGREGSSRYHRTFTACRGPTASCACPVTGAGRRGMRPGRWPRRPFLPALGRVFATGARDRLRSSRRLSPARCTLRYSSPSARCQRGYRAGTIAQGGLAGGPGEGNPHAGTWR